MRSVLLALTICAGPAAAVAQDYPLRIPAPGGEVILPDAAARCAHDPYRYAAARRVGDTLYLSGVIVYRAPGEGPMSPPSRPRLAAPSTSSRPP